MAAKDPLPVSTPESRRPIDPSAGAAAAAFYQALRTAPAPIMVLDHMGQVHLLSQGWIELAGGHPAGLRAVEEWAAATCRQGRTAAAKPAGAAAEFSIRIREGGRRDWSFVIAPLGGLPDGGGLFVCIAHDVTGRKDATEAAREDRFQELLEALPAAVYTTDEAGRITFYNRAAADLWGHRPPLGTSEWCGSWRLQWPDGRPMPHDQCPMAEALRSGRATRGGEAVAIRPDGTAVPFIPYPTPLHDDTGRLVGAVNMLVDITERKAAEQVLRDSEARLQLLAREVDHRAKNMLATVQAIAHMMRADSVPRFVEALTGRLHALSRAHSLLAEGRWGGADLRRLVEEEFAAFGPPDGGRTTMIGPSLMLSAEAAQSLAMALHELTTNAAKYGALSVPEGRVSVGWQRQDDGGLLLQWCESGGPPVRHARSTGFGTELINITISRQLGGSLRFDWRRDGLVCEMRLPRERLGSD